MLDIMEVRLVTQLSRVMVCVHAAITVQLDPQVLRRTIVQQGHTAHPQAVHLKTTVRTAVSIHIQAQESVPVQIAP